uniref:Uncharacterized protein n=1 Tax=Arundo donax TaxID=35708 RepID=A0A0A9BRV5_ARUDO
MKDHSISNNLFFLSMGKHGIMYKSATSFSILQTIAQ